MTATFRAIHRWIGLAFLLFWIVQAASGVFLVFHREIDDWTLGGEAGQPLDLILLGQRIGTIEAEREATATSIFSSTGYSDRFDVHLEDEATGTVTIARVDGHGQLLRERALDAPALGGGFYLAVNRLHRHLLAGSAGAWLVGISGILLLSNILIGLKLAWPARSQWRRALRPRRTRSVPAAAYGWHRALGLWVAPLALVTISCGVLLAFEDGTARLLGAEGGTPSVQRDIVEGIFITPAEAVEAALRRYPQADFTGVQMPSAARPLYSVFLRQRSEADQAYGATRVFVEASSGSIVGAYDPLGTGAADRFMGVLLPIHSGQIGGRAGRIAVLAVGLWLIGMIALGSALWWVRRRQAARRSASKIGTGGRYAPQNSC